MTINIILAGISFLFGACSLILSYMYPENVETYIGFESVFVFFVYACFISVMCAFSRIKHEPLLIMFAIFINAFYFFRFCTLIINPEHKFAGVYFYSNEYLKLWCVVFAHTVAFVVALYVAIAISKSAGIRQYFREQIISDTMLRRSRKLLLFILIFKIYLFYFAGGQPSFQLDNKRDKIYIWLDFLSDMDLVFIAFLAVHFFSFQKSGRIDWKTIVIYQGLYFVTRTLLGSKSSMYVLLVLTAMCLAVYFPRYKLEINWKKTFLVPIFALLIIVSFTAGEFFRLAYQAVGPNVVIDKGELFNMAKQNVENSSDAEQMSSFAQTFIEKVIKRLNLIDTHMYIVNDKNIERTDKYISVFQLMKAIPNRVFHYKFFDDVFPTDYGFDLIYTTETEEEVNTVYHSEPMSVFGYHKLLFGEFFGVFFSFVLMLIFALAMDMSMVSNYGYILRLLILHWASFALQGQGYDAIATEVSPYIVMLPTVLFIITLKIKWPQIKILKDSRVN